MKAKIAIWSIVVLALVFPGDRGFAAIAKDSDQSVIGTLKWEIREEASGRMLASGDGPIRLIDLTITERPSERGRLMDKRIRLTDVFDIGMAESPTLSRAEKVGFGITAKRTDMASFSWEWFNITDGIRAVKLQEGGELQVEVKEINGAWEIARTDFITDVSLRIAQPGTAGQGIQPVWRIKIFKGSSISWPSKMSAEVVPAAVIPTDPNSYSCQAPDQTQAAIRSSGSKGIESLLTQNPGDFWIRLAYIDTNGGSSAFRSSTGTPSGPVDPAIIARFQKEYEARPEDTETAYLYAYSLIHRNTPKTIEILTSLSRRAPSFPPAWLSLAIIHQSPNFMDAVKVKTHVEGYLTRCPDNFESRTVSLAATLDKSEVQTAYAKGLRERIAGKADAQTLSLYRSLWQMESKIAPPGDQSGFRKQIEADLKFLDGLNRDAFPQASQVLMEGYQRIGDKDAMNRAMRQMSSSMASSSLVFLQARMEWSRSNPAPPSNASPEIRTTFLRKQLQFLDEWKTRIPGSQDLLALRFTALSSLPDTADDVLLSEANQALNSRTGLTTNSLEILKVLAQRGLMLDRIPALVQESLDSVARTSQVLSLLQQSDLNGGPYLALSEENRKWTTDTSAWSILTAVYVKKMELEKAAAVLREWDKAINERRKRAEAVNEKMSTQARTASASVTSRSPIDSLESLIVSGLPNDESRYYEACAQLASAEGRALDALTFYQSALRMTYGRSSVPQNIMEQDAGKQAAALWKKLGGSDAAWLVWLDSVRTVPAPKMRSVPQWSVTNRAVPDFSLPDQNKKSWTLDSLKGKTTLINVWATWCQPCRLELPHLQELYDQIKDRGDVQVITLNVDEDQSLVEPFLKNNKFSFPSLYSRSFVETFAGPIGIPTTWISDSTGTIRFESRGFGGDGTNWVAQTLGQIDRVRTAAR